MIETTIAGDGLHPLSLSMNPLPFFRASLPWSNAPGEAIVFAPEKHPHP
jgi:hypothetical protein